MHRSFTKSRHVSNQDRATERIFINVIITLAGNNLPCPKLVSECNAELHVTLTKHHNETRYENDKSQQQNGFSQCRNGRLLEYNSKIADRQGRVTNQHFAKVK